MLVSDKACACSDNVQGNFLIFLCLHLGAMECSYVHTWVQVQGIPYVSPFHLYSVCRECSLWELRPASCRKSTILLQSEATTLAFDSWFSMHWPQKSYKHSSSKSQHGGPPQKSQHFRGREGNTRSQRSSWGTWWGNVLQSPPNEIPWNNSCQNRLMCCLFYAGEKPETPGPGVISLLLAYLQHRRLG